jgi:hypothetical protein
MRTIVRRQKRPSEGEKATAGPSASPQEDSCEEAGSLIAGNPETIARDKTECPYCEITICDVLENVQSSCGTNGIERVNG